MRLSILASAILLLLPAALAAGTATSGCTVPFPNPRDDAEVIADFEHCYLILHGSTPLQKLSLGWHNLVRRLAGLGGRFGPSPEEARLARLVQSGRVAYEILRFENWQHRPAQGPRLDYLVRAFEADPPEDEIARWVLGEDGGWRMGVVTPLPGPYRLPSLAEARARLEERWKTVENLHYVVYGFGPVGVTRSCVHLLRPCLEFTADGSRFLYSPRQERLFRFRSELGTFRVERKDEVSRLESYLAIARAMAGERTLVLGMGDEFLIAEEAGASLEAQDQAQPEVELGQVPRWEGSRAVQ